MKSKPKGAYALAGVDIDAADKIKELIKQHARSTFRPEVLTDIGLFGGMFQFKGYKEPVLISSVDGVGTKLKIASLMDRHDTIGIDLVSHCINDILCCGAEPLFFLDYIAAGRLIPKRVDSIVSGLAKACRQAGCALIGGETAEMPGIYHGDDYDLAGFIIGVVERNNILTGSAIKVDDVILGLPSNGLHTNGYSLVRRVFKIENSAAPLNKFYPKLSRKLGEELLEPHRCYYPQLKPLLKKIKGLAHITGGGIAGNLPRILPRGLGAQINKKAWSVPPIFKLIQQQGKVTEAEMYRVFNMGIGMIIVCSPEKVENITNKLTDSVVIGSVAKASKAKRITIS
ncbi:phosphoribosylformylglycinamidine cyclo-ligase [Chloroflexota bacterium]